MNDQQEPFAYIVVILEQNADTLQQDLTNVSMHFVCMLLSVSAIFWPYSLSFRNLSPFLMSLGFYIATELVFLNANHTLGELTPFVVMLFYYVYCIACRALIQFLATPRPSTQSDDDSSDSDSDSSEEEDNLTEQAEDVEYEEQAEYEEEEIVGIVPPPSDEEEKEGVCVHITDAATQSFYKENWTFGSDWISTPMGRFVRNLEVHGSFILNNRHRIDKSDVHPGQGILFIQLNDNWIVRATWRILAKIEVPSSPEDQSSDEHTFSLLTASVIN